MNLVFAPQGVLGKALYSHPYYLLPLKNAFVRIKKALHIYIYIYIYCIIERERGSDWNDLGEREKWKDYARGIIISCCCCLRKRYIRASRRNRSERERDIKEYIESYNT